MTLLVDDKIDAIHNFYKDRPVSEWRSDLVKSVTEAQVRGFSFPSFPDPELQRHLQGAPNELAIRGALHFREKCLEIAAQCGRPPKEGDALIDFGAGWGRICRAFMRDFAASRIYAVEPYDFIIEARKHNAMINFVKSDPHPPLLFKDGFADFLVSYSIFTHLTEARLREWIVEFARVVKPGGLVFLTILGTHFLKGMIDAHHALEKGETVDFWRKLIAERLPRNDIPAVIDKIEKGGFFFLPDPRANTSDYAEAFVTARWFEANAAHLFDVVGYIADGSTAQDIIALRRR